ncbi:ABC transporter substrate-binding protein [Nonomuraea ferruginea]
MRLAAGPDFRHFTLNGSSEKLRDVRVRQAIQLGVDRMSIARSDLQGLDWPATPLGNHFFMPTQEGYRDNAGSFGAYDPERAKRLLDEAGWKLDGTVRKKAGDPLDLRFVVPRPGRSSASRKASWRRACSPRSGSS